MLVLQLFRGQNLILRLTLVFSLGINLDKKAYKLLALVTHKVIISRDVHFFEKHFPYHFSTTQNTLISSIYPPQIFIPTVTGLNDPTTISIPDASQYSLSSTIISQSTSPYLPTQNTSQIHQPTPISTLPRKSTRAMQPSTLLKYYVCSSTNH